MRDTIYKILMKQNWEEVKAKLNSVVLLSAHKEILFDKQSEIDEAASDHEKLKNMVEKFIENFEFLTQI